MISFIKKIIGQKADSDCCGVEIKEVQDDSSCGSSNETKNDSSCK